MNAPQPAKTKAVAIRARNVVLKVFITFPLFCQRIGFFRIRPVVNLSFVRYGLESRNFRHNVNLTGRINLKGHCYLDCLTVLIGIIVPENALEHIAFLLFAPASENGGNLVIGNEAYVCVGQTVSLSCLGFCKSRERKAAGNTVSLQVYIILSGSRVDGVVVEVEVVVLVETSGDENEKIFLGSSVVGNLGDTLLPFFVGFLFLLGIGRNTDQNGRQKAHRDGKYLFHD